MHKRLITLLGAVAIVAVACQGATATTAPTAAPATAAPATAAPATAAPATAAPASVAPSASAAAVDPRFNTTYPTRVKAGTPGGTAIVAEWQQVDTLNPYYAGANTDYEVLTATARSLTMITDDLRYAPDLAAEIPTIANGGVQIPGANGDAMTVTWKLAPAKWSDGTAITCDDVAYTWSWNMDPANTALYGGTVGWSDITAVDCPDPQTAVMHFKNVYEGYLGLYLAVLPKAYMSKIPVKDASSQSYPLSDAIASVPVSGPFMYKSIAKDLSQIDLVRNPLYTSPDWAGPAHQAYLDGITFKYYSDADAMIAGYKAGEYDIAYDLTESDLPKLADLQASGQVLDQQGLTYELLRPNWASKVMSDVAMRQALQLAVDRNAINTRLLAGKATPAYVNTSPLMYYYDQSIQPYSQDLAKANAILDAAGWVKGSDGIRAKNGVKAQITMCTTTRQVRGDTLALISSWLKQLGIDAKVSQVPSTVIFGAYSTTAATTACNLAHGTFDIAEHAFVVSPDPIANYVTYNSKTTEPNGSNDAKINDPLIDKALDAVKGTVDPAVITDAYKTFFQQYLSQAVEVPLYYRHDVYIVNPKVGNFVGNGTTATGSWNAQDWFLGQ